MYDWHLLPSRPSIHRHTRLHSLIEFPQPGEEFFTRQFHWMPRLRLLTLCFPALDAVDLPVPRRHVAVERRVGSLEQSHQCFKVWHYQSLPNCMSLYISARSSARVTSSCNILTSSLYPAKITRGSSGSRPNSRAACSAHSGTTSSTHTPVVVMASRSASSAQRSIIVFSAYSNSRLLPAFPHSRLPATRRQCA